MQSPPVRMRLLYVLIAGACVTACGAVDKVLEGNVAPNARLSVDMPAAAISVPRGASHEFTVSVTRVGEYNGPVELIVDNGPEGITAQVGAQNTVGQVTTVPVTLQVGTGMSLGAHTMRVLARAPRLPDVARVLNVTVLPQPAYDLAASRQSITVVKGGIAPFTVSATRTNFTAPITLALEATSGLSATFAESPLAGTSTAATIVASDAIATGTYEAKLRGTADGLAAREVTLTITVISDPLQLIVEAPTTRQGTSVSTPVVINRNGFSAPVSLAASGLPAGVTATFDPASASGSSATMTLTVAPTVAAQTHTATVNASADGAVIASSLFSFTVTASSVALSLSPAGVSLFQATNTTAKLTLTRTALEAPVAIDFIGLPAGVTATASPASVAGNETTITVAASSAAAAGDFVGTVRATPQGWPTAGSPTLTFTITVREVPGTNGNVILDWSRCTAPQWVAYQDGTNAWQQVITSSGGVYRFTSTQPRGGFAFADADGVTLRYMTNAQLIAAPHDMCPPVVTTGTKTVRGTGAHVGASETYTYNLGGRTATSTTAAPEFSILNVPDGVFDLMVWGSPTLTGFRGLIRRDQDIPDGETMGAIDLVGTEAFAPLRPNVTITGVVNGDQAVSHAMSYLTGGACTESKLYTTGPTGTVSQMMGVPENLQRATDFHMITINAVGPSRSRSSTVVFQKMLARTVALSPNTGVPSVTSLTGNYRRLQLSVGTVSAQLNGTAVFRYTNGGRTVTLQATMQYVNSTLLSLSLPDFSTVTGWQDAYAMPSSASGSWTLNIDGGALAVPLCTEARTTFNTRLFGTF